MFELIPTDAALLKYSLKIDATFLGMILNSMQKSFHQRSMQKMYHVVHSSMTFSWASL